MRRSSPQSDLPTAGIPVARAVRATGETAAARTRGLRTPLWRARYPLLFVSPFFLLFAIFAVYPIGFSLWLSIHSWRGMGEMKFVALDNYTLLLRDTLFWNSMLNSAILFVIYVPLMTFLACVLATILHADFVKLQGLW